MLASLALLSADDFHALAVLSALHGAAMAFSLPALQSMPPRLVAERHLARTNALVSLTDEIAIVLGPVAGGIAIAAFGFRGAFVFDALTYAIGLVDPAAGPAAPGRPDHRRRWRGAAGAAARRPGGLEAHRPLPAAPPHGVACTFAVHLLYGMALLAEPLYVRDTLGSSEEVFAALQTAFGVFLVGGGVLAARLGERLASFGWVVLGVGASGLAAIVYLGTPWLIVAFAGVAAWGVATAIISRTVPDASSSARSPERAHGRVLSADMWRPARPSWWASAWRAPSSACSACRGRSRWSACRWRPGPCGWPLPTAATSGWTRIPRRSSG